MAYLLMHVPAEQPLIRSMVPFVNSFCEQCMLSKAEVEAVFGLAVMRVCTSVCMSAYQIRREPDNQYLLISAAPAWKLLQRLADESKERREHPPAAVFREACGGSL